MTSYLIERDPIPDLPVSTRRKSAIKQPPPLRGRALMKPSCGERSISTSGSLRRHVRAGNLLERGPGVTVDRTTARRPKPRWCGPVHVALEVGGVEGRRVAVVSRGRGLATWSGGPREDRFVRPDGLCREGHKEGGKEGGMDGPRGLCGHYLHDTPAAISVARAWGKIVTEEHHTCDVGGEPR